MEYFIPAWHKQYQDWAISVPNIENWDITNHMKILDRNDYRIGLIITDYQPQLITKLNNLSLYPDKLFSIYDYLQGIESLESKVVEVSDFNWPSNAYFNFGPFRTQVVWHDQLYAVVTYDFEGKILKLEYLTDPKRTVIMDSRGFISSIEDSDTITYYDPYGTWRFKKDRHSSQITVNPASSFCQKDHYPNIDSLINEVLAAYLNKNVTQNDNLIVTADDDSTFKATIFDNYRVLYLINQNVPYQKLLPSLINKQLIVNNQEVANDFSKKYTISYIPTYNSEFKLGHSQRKKVRKIAFYAEKAEPHEIEAIINSLCNYLTEHDDEELTVLTYSLEKANSVEETIEKIKHDNQAKFIINDDPATKRDFSDDEALDQTKLAKITVKTARLTNISDLLKELDTTRVLINWGSLDELMQISAVNTGIPQIQNFESNLVISQKNGAICQNVQEIPTYLDKYLNSLNNWNQALVANIEIINRYSEENIIELWQELLENNGSK